MSDWKEVGQNEVWDYKAEGVDAEISGILRDVETEVGPNKSTLYTLKTSTGETISVWGSTIIDTRLKNVEVGEEVKIIYLGKMKSEKRKGAEYHNFKVFHRLLESNDVEVTPDIDFDQLTAELDEDKKNETKTAKTKA